MRPDEYGAALIAAGINVDLPAPERDRQASRLLGISERTALRYRRGGGEVPEPVARLLAVAAIVPAARRWLMENAGQATE